MGNHFRKLWGKEAGWAHSVLFTADLKTFSERLGSSKKIKAEVNVKKEEERQEDIKVQTKVTTTVATKRKIKEEEDSSADGETKKAKGKVAIQASETTQTRRTSKRLRKK